MALGRSASLLARVVLGLLLLMAAIALGLFLLVHSDPGRRFAANRIEELVTDNIPGALSIGRLEQLGPSLVRASDVRFYHPDGTLVLEAKHAEIVPDLAMALHGRLGFERAAVDGGFIVLATDPDGRLSLEATMNEKSPPGQPSKPGGGLHYALRAIHVQHFTTVVRVIPNETLRVHGIEGFVGVRRIETDGVQIELDRISGRVEQEIAGVHVALERVDGWIHAEEHHAAHLNAQAKLGDGELKADIDYFDRKEKPLEVKLHEKKGLAATTTAWLLHAASAFSGALDVSSDG